MIDIRALSDKGPINDNQDFYLFKNTKYNESIFCVTDGVGGRPCGKIASKHAAESFIDYFSSFYSNNIWYGVNYINNLLLHYANNNPTCINMATTLTGGWIINGVLTGVHIGDSRAFLLRSGYMKQLTKDHNEYEEHKARMMMYEGRKNVLTNALGMNSIKFDSFKEFLRYRDRILFMTDGAYNSLNENEIVYLNKVYSNNDLFVKALFNRIALARPTDNYTVLSVDYI
jgi:protein phosphatase